MIYDRLRVFVSSRMQELAEERRAVKEALDVLRIDAWVFEEDAGARAGSYEDTYLAELDKADLYLGIFWRGAGRYTLEELAHARASGTDCLIYEKRTDIEGQRDPELQAFLDTLGDVRTGLTSRWFDTVDELREAVQVDLARWQTERARQAREARASPRRVVAATALGRDLTVLRDRVQSFWVDGVLARILAGGASMAVSAETRPEAVERAWEAVLEQPFEESRVLGPETDIAEVYAELQGSMLVLGEPGAGKTVQLLTLCRALLDDTRADPTLPVPVVLLLASWAGQPFGAWVADELVSKYQVPRRVAEAWLADNRLVLLLDGLDEVDHGRHGACVDAIHAHLVEVGAGGVVVTCRAAEYEAQARSQRLRLNGAVALRPLSVAQIADFLATSGPALDGLRAAIGEDADLLELARSPLLLGIMRRAYAGVSREALVAASARGTQRRHLFDAYVEQAFGRVPANDPSRVALMRQLSWVARGLQRSGRTLFLLEELQATWLERRWQRWLHLVLVAVVAAGIGEVLAGLFWESAARLSDDVESGLASLTRGQVQLHLATWFLGVAAVAQARLGKRWASTWREVGTFALHLGEGLAVWAAIALLFRLGRWAPTPTFADGILWMTGAAAAAFIAADAVRGSVFTRVRPVEHLAFSLRAAVRGAPVGAIAGLLPAAVYAVSFDDPADVYFRWADAEATAQGRAVYAVTLPMVGALFGALVSGVEARMVDERVRPNEGIRRSLGSALRVGGAAAVGAAVVIGAAIALLDPSRGRLVDALPDILLFGGAGAVLVGATCGLLFGGLAVIAHGVLRVLLAATGQLPLRVEHALDDAVERGLLRRVGGGWLFPHRTLQEDFAARGEAPGATAAGARG